MIFVQLADGFPLPLLPLQILRVNLATDVFQLGRLLNCRSQGRSAFVGFFSNTYIFAAAAVVIGLQLVAVYFEPLAKILNTVQPNNIDWLVIISSIILPVTIVETVKIFQVKLG